MDTDTVAERALYRDLAKIMSTMRNERYCDVEAAMEARIRTYLKVAPGAAVGVEMAMGWVLPEGAEAWPVYTTRFRTLGAGDWPDDHPPQTAPDHAIAAVAEPALDELLPMPVALGEVIPLAPSRSGNVPRFSTSATVLSFPTV